MTITVVNQLPEDRWRAFVDEHPQGNIFHTPEMFSVYAAARGHVPELWAAVDGDQILALFIPVRIYLQNGLLRGLTARTVVHGSILSCPGEAGNAASRLLLQAYKRGSGRRSLFTELRNISPLEHLLPLLSAEGFAYEDHLNYLIDLDRPAEQVFAGIGKRTQKNIRKGLHKSLVSIEEVRDASGVDECYMLLETTYHAAHVPLADGTLFHAACDILTPKKMIRFTIARVGTEPAASSIELLYKDTLYGWYGGMDRAYAAYNPNELLMWHILSWGVENGFRTYDFGGAGKPHEEYGVRDFKAKFGGQLVCFGRNFWVPSPALMSASTFGYSVLKRFLY